MQNKLIKLSSEILQICDKNKITISSAESCTGGLISQYFTSHPGSSKVFLGGFVTYSNNSKIKILNVKEETLKNYGAVSENTVIEMSEAAKIILNTDISLAVSGIAGPDGGSNDKPVGLELPDNITLCVIPNLVQASILIDDSMEADECIITFFSLPLKFLILSRSNLF